MFVSLSCFGIYVKLCVVNHGSCKKGRRVWLTTGALLHVISHAIRRRLRNGYAIELRVVKHWEACGLAIKCNASNFIFHSGEIVASRKNGSWDPHYLFFMNAVDCLSCRPPTGKPGDIMTY